MYKRALITGLDRDYCYILREFLSLRDLYVTVALDYKEGLDKLFYEKPDLTIIESAGKEPVQNLIDVINESNEFELVDFASGQALADGIKSVLLFDDKSQINSLFEYLKQALSRPQTEPPQDSLDEGSLESTFYPSLLIDLYMNKRSGVLSIDSSTNLIIYFIGGNPVFAEGGDIDTAIGRILLNSGKIDKETYEKTLDVASQNKQKFGQILFEMGITSPHELNSFLEFQMQEKILKGFFYVRGRYVFKGGEDFADRIVMYQVDLSKVIYEGVKRYIDAGSLGESNPTITIDPKLRSEIDDLGLKPKELRFVQLLKDTATVREVLEGSRLERPEALKLLYFLSLFRLINIRGVSTEQIGRASIENMIRENETWAGVSGDTEFHTDIESVFAELKELESEQITETAQSAEIDEPAGDVGRQDTNEPVTVKETEYEIRSTDTVSFDSLLGHSEEDKVQNDTIESGSELGFESPESSVIADGSDEQGFYILDNDREEPISGAHTNESGFDFGTEAAREEATSEDEFSSPSKLQKSGQFEFGNERRENGQDEPVYSTGQRDESGITDLFQPYRDFEDDAQYGEDVWHPEEETDHAFTDLSEAADAPTSTESTEGGVEIQSGFRDRVSQFHSAMEQKDYYEVLGVSRDSTTDEIRSSYYQLVKYYHPDVNPNADHETRAMAEEIFTLITTAYETLSQKEKRQQYDSHEELSVLKSQAKYIYDAEMAFKKGITFLIQRNYPEAEKHIREAVSINPEESAYLGAHGWTRFLSSDDKSSILGEVKNTIETAIKMNDKIPENYYYLGCVFKYTNDLKNAGKNFEKAIDLDPNYIEAKREVRLINTRRTSVINDRKIEKNFWSSLFKK